MQTTDEENLATTPRGITLDVYTPNMSDDAVWRIASWSELITERSPALAAWLHSLAVEEIYRRGADSPVEAKTPALPIDWSNAELASALLAAFGFEHSNQYRGLDSFTKTLSMAIAAIAANRLQKDSNA